MTDPADRPLTTEPIFATLARHGVDYVLIGGVASLAHGATRATKDLDICPAWTTANLERLAAALRELDGRITFEQGSIELTPDRKLIAGMEIGNWRTTAGDVDVLLGIPRDRRRELARYDELAADAALIEIDGHQVKVASLTAIIRSKEIAGRLKDRQALPELRMLHNRQHGPAAKPDRDRGPEPPGAGCGI